MCVFYAGVECKFSDYKGEGTSFNLSQLQLTLQIRVQSHLELRNAADLQQQKSAMAFGLCHGQPLWGDPPKKRAAASELRITAWWPMGAWTFHTSAFLCEVRMRLLGHCWMHVARSCILWAASVISRDMSKGSSLGPSGWDSLTGQQHSLHPLRIRAEESPADIRWMILQASHMQAGPHYPAEIRTFTI